VLISNRSFVLFVSVNKYSRFYVCREEIVLKNCSAFVCCTIIFKCSLSHGTLRYICLSLCFGATAPQWARTSSFTRFLDHTQWRTTVGRTPLDEWSARRRNLYLTTQDTHHRQDIHAPGGIWTHNLSRRAAVDLRLRPRVHWDRHLKTRMEEKNHGCACPSAFDSYA